MLSIACTCAQRKPYDTLNPTWLRRRLANAGCCSTSVLSSRVGPWRHTRCPSFVATCIDRTAALHQAPDAPHQGLLPRTGSSDADPDGCVPLLMVPHRVKLNEVHAMVQRRPVALQGLLRQLAGGAPGERCATNGRLKASYIPPLQLLSLRTATQVDDCRWKG
jgi:hypothetical protein